MCNLKIGGHHNENLIQIIQAIHFISVSKGSLFIPLYALQHGTHSEGYSEIREITTVLLGYIYILSPNTL